MAISAYSSYQNSSPRGLAMALAVVSAVMLSPLYINNQRSESWYETRRGSGFFLPVVLAGLIVAIRKTTTSNSPQTGCRASDLDESKAFRIASSSWGLAGILLMLIFLLSWQPSVQHLFWR